MQALSSPRLLPALLASFIPLLFSAALRGSEAKSPIAAQFQPVLDDHLVAGAVALVGSEDRVLDVETMGYADVAARRPMTPDTLFWIASMTKAVTGTAMMMLVDEGKVGVDDPVEKFLPEFRDQMLVTEQDKDHAILKRPGHPITIRDLLTHTSGLTPTTPLEKHVDTLSLRENVMLYPLIPLRFPRGTKYEYSNAGINTAGRIVEVVSGMPFDEFLQRRLFTPLGMKDTTFWPDAGQIRRLAKSYRPNADRAGLEETPIEQLSYPLSDRRRGVCPAGGLFSTAGDVYLFCRMICHGGTYNGRRYLSPSAVNRMTATQIGELPMASPNLDYGYGFGWLTRRHVHRENDPVNLGTFGAGGAYNTNMWINRPRHLITVWMVQQADFPEDLRSRVRNTLMKAAVDEFGR